MSPLLCLPRTTQDPGISNLKLLETVLESPEQLQLHFSPAPAAPCRAHNTDHDNVCTVLGAVYPEAAMAEEMDDAVRQLVRRCGRVQKTGLANLLSSTITGRALPFGIAVY
jgi:hypothetical protein